MRVALTGPDGDAGSLGEGLRALGVETVGVPLLETVLLEGCISAWERECPQGRRYDYVAFSSPRAVDAFWKLRERFSRIHVEGCLAVGPETARRARATGWGPEERVIEGKGSGASGLLETIRSIQGRTPWGDKAYFGSVKDRRVFLPVSERTTGELADGLRKLGADVEVLRFYTVRTVPGVDARVKDLVCGTPDAVLLASPSAAEALVAGAGPERGHLPPLLAIGPTTAEAMGKLALPVAGTAEEPTPLGIVAAMKERA